MPASPRKAPILRSIGIPEGFRVRGESVSRVEGFSDAAFAFAVTLLVISLDVPATFDQMLDVMRGVPAFIVCFAMLCWLWVTHYKFFRRYGLEDPLTIALNCMLLFVIMLYVYPLKFVFTIFIGMIPPHIRPANAGRIQSSQVDDLFVIYGVGFIAVFALFGLMNLRAWRLRETLDLNAIERLVTREEIARCFTLVGIGALSVTLALALSGISNGMSGLAGFVYGLIGVGEFVLARWYGQRREALLQDTRQRSHVTA